MFRQTWDKIFLHIQQDMYCFLLNLKGLQNVFFSSQGLVKLGEFIFRGIPQEMRQAFLQIFRFSRYMCKIIDVYQKYYDLAERLMFCREQGNYTSRS